MLALCQQIKLYLIQGHQTVFLLILKGGQNDKFCRIFNQEKILYLGMLSSMNMFFHIKGLRILATELTVLAFIIKVLLQKINLFSVSHYKSSLQPVVILKITIIMIMNQKINLFWVNHKNLFLHPMIMLIMTMNQTVKFQKKFVTIKTKTSTKIMKQHNQFEWVPEQKDHLSIYKIIIVISMFPPHLQELNILWILLSYNKLSPSYTSFVMSLSSYIESNTYSEVVKHYCWIKAIQYNCLLYTSPSPRD